MTAIYEPAGKGNEESGLCLNLYRGCGHACTYCYAPSATFTKRKRFYDPEFIQPREDILKQTVKDAARLNKKGDINRLVLLCLSCDPYQPADVEHGITRTAIEILMQHQLPVRILTKGGLRAERDLDLLAKDPRSEFGCTMTNDEDRASQAWEPNAALPGERMEVLKKAHSMGIKTWISMEPVLDPEAVYRLLEKMKDYVGIFKIGKLNYHRREKMIDWIKFRARVIEKCQGLGVRYFIKCDLAEIPPALDPALVGDPRSL